MSQLFWTQAEVDAGDAPKARRKCDKCGNYYHAKRQACPVCHPDTMRTVVTSWDEPGRKRKQCPSCKKYIGHSQEVCPNCQAQQPAKVAKAADNGEAVDVPNPPDDLDTKKQVSDYQQPSALTPRKVTGHWPIQDRNDTEASLSVRTCGCRMKIVTAVGVMANEKKPPKLPSDRSPEKVLAWAEAVVEWGHTEKHGHIAPCALRAMALAELGLGAAYDEVYSLLLNFGCNLDEPFDSVAVTDGWDGADDSDECLHEMVDDDGVCMDCGKTGLR